MSKKRVILHTSLGEVNMLPAGGWLWLSASPDNPLHVGGKAILFHLGLGLRDKNERVLWVPTWDPLTERWFPGPSEFPEKEIARIQKRIVCAVDNGKLRCA
jgi:hypothetical protein